MAPRFCSICRQPVAEGSTLCAQHLGQASRFAASFGQDGPATTEPQKEDGHEAAPSAADTPATSLASSLAASFEGLVQWAAGEPQPRRRWPQLTVYFLRGKLFVRDYYDAVPREPAPGSEGEPAREGYQLSDEATRAAFAPDGPVMRRLEEIFAERLEALQRRDIQMLSIDFRTYANTIVIGETRRDKGRDALATYEMRDGQFVLAADAA